MYELILKALYRLNNLNSAQERAQYLQSLKPTARKLRRSYNPYSASSVQANYSPQEVQAAYMLRYFPQYSQVIRVILNRLRSTQISLLFEQEELSACFFGAGPAPEVYGVTQFLNTLSNRIQKFTAYTFDIISEEWSYSRNITEEYLIPSIWQNRAFKLISNKFDLTENNCFSRYSSAVNSARLIVFQNCLNEINQNLHPTVVDNFKALVGMMATESILVIIDLSSYPIALQLISQIETAIKSEKLGGILNSPSEGESRYDAVSLRDTLPQVITQNLLTGEDGLIPRRYIKYHSLVIRKSHQSISNKA